MLNLLLIVTGLFVFRANFLNWILVAIVLERHVLFFAILILSQNAILILFSLLAI